MIPGEENLGQQDSHAEQCQAAEAADPAEHELFVAQTELFSIRLKCIRVEMAILDLRMNTMLIDILPDLAPEAAAAVRGLIKPVKNRKAG
jgi:hypothetical protein